MSQLEKLTIKGFKSIRSLEGLELRRLNVLIGANSAGKSNFIAFFRLLNELIEGRLQLHVAQRGGPDALLHYGRRTTPELVAELWLGRYSYRFGLVPTVDNRLILSEESVSVSGSGSLSTQPLGDGHAESLLLRSYPPIASVLQELRLYHFHDTSDAANVKRIGAINDNLFLRPDAGNLAAFLFRLKVQHRAEYERIRDSVRMVMPAFDDFLLRPSPFEPNSIALEWREQGSDFPFLAHQLSDGTLRFICLATLLLQPELPSTLLIDEPELGLHPYAINVLASLLRSASTRTQLILATQSVTLIDLLELEDLIVVERHEGQSVFKRLPSVEFEQWLEEYSLGELWMKNVLGGRPTR